MEYRIDQDQESALLHVTTIGPLCVTGLKHMSNDLVPLCRSGSFFRLLIEHSGPDLELEKLTTSDVLSYAQFQLQFADIIPHLYIAHVAEEPLLFGLSRMWCTLAESFGLNIRFQIFEERTEARQWLFHDAEPLAHVTPEVIS